MSMRNTDACEAQGCAWGTRMRMSNTDECEKTNKRKKHVARVIAQILKIEGLTNAQMRGPGRKQANVGYVWYRVGEKEDCHYWKAAHEV
jgi:hypothetical protein